MSLWGIKWKTQKGLENTLPGDMMSWFLKILFVWIILFQSLNSFSEENKQDKDKKKDIKPTVNVNGRIQIRHDYNMSSGLDSLSEKRNSFSLRRVWLDINGEFTPLVEYLINFYGENAISGSGEGVLGAAYVMFKPSEHFRILFGIMDVPFSREIFSSNRKLLFIDRAEASRYNAVVMDIGILVDGYFFNKKLHYWVGMMNGAGGTEDGVNGFRVSGSETNNQFDFLVRLQLDPMTPWKNGVAYMDGKTRYTIGASFYYSPHRDPRIGMAFGGTKDFIGMSADLGLTFWRLYFEGGFIYQMGKSDTSYSTVFAVSSNPEAYTAFFGQIGIKAIKKYLMFAARFDQYEEKTGLSFDDAIQEGTFSLTWFILGTGHNLKYQTEINQQFKKGSDTTNSANKETRWRNQITFAF